MRLMHSRTPPEAVRASTRLGTVVYAAGDEDLMHFRNLFLDRAEDVAETIQVYTSRLDDCLSMSRTFFHGEARLGRSGAALTEADRKALIDEQDLAFIDVGGAQKHAGRTSFGHMYWYKNSWVSSDIILALKYGLRPAERGLVREGGEALWSFPEDYPRRAKAAVERELTRVAAD
jgi:hypothetical protein